MLNRTPRPTGDVVGSGGPRDVEAILKAIDALDCSQDERAWTQ